MHIEYDGVRSNLDHLGPSDQQLLASTAQAYIEAGMRPPILSVIVEGRDVTKQPDLWPPSVRNYRGPGRLELVD